MRREENQTVGIRSSYADFEELEDFALEEIPCEALEKQIWRDQLFIRRFGRFGDFAHEKFPCDTLQANPFDELEARQLRGMLEAKRLRGG